MYDAISRDSCVSLLQSVCRSETKSMWESSCFIYSPRVHASTHEPGNTRYLFNEHTRCDVTDLQRFQSLSALVAVAPFPPFLHTDGPKTLVYRDLISRHPGRYVSDHKQAGDEREVDVNHKAVCF